MARGAAGLLVWPSVFTQDVPLWYWIEYEDGARYVVLAGRLSLKYRRTSLSVRVVPKFSSYQSWLFAEPPAPQNGSLVGSPSTAPATLPPDPVWEADAVAPEARLAGSPVRSTPALASMSTMRGLSCTTWLGAFSPGTAVRWVTVPFVVTSPVAGSQVKGTRELTVAARVPLT